MGDIFDSVAAQPQTPPVNTPASTATSGDIFDKVAAQQAQTATSAPAKTATPEATFISPDNAVDANESNVLTGVSKGAAEAAHTVGAVMGKVMPNSWRDALGLPSSFKQPDYLQSTSGAETAGKVGEGIAEFVMGDEALKGLQITERLGLAQKMAQMAKSSPYIAKILEHGLTAIRGGAVTVPQQMLHSATPTEALKTGGEAALLGAGTGAAIEGASKLADVTGVSEKLASARRGGILSGGKKGLEDAVQQAADTGKSIAESRPVAPVDKYPVSVVHDADGNVISADGRHRVVEAWERGDQKIPVTTKLADGTTEVIDQTPQATAKKMGLGNTVKEARQSIDATDAQQQGVRAGNGKSRPPVYEAPAPKTSPDVTPVGDSSKAKSIRTTIQDVSNDVKAKSQGLYRQLDAASGGRWQRFEDQISNLEDKMDEVNGIDDDAYDRLETKRNDIETSQAQMIEDLKDKGIDPETADAAVAHYKQSMALRDLDKAVKGATKGDISVGQAEKIGPGTFLNRVQKLKDSGRLQQALGEDGAKTLLKQAYDAKNARDVRRIALGLGGVAASAAGFAHPFGAVKAAAELAVTQ